MSGHSKWSTIKHKKAIIDSKRGKAFTKLIKEITVAARLGGGDTEGNGNPRLRTLLEKAKAINMPLDNAVRAIKKGTGELPGVNYEAYMYEGYGPEGIAVIVETLTDNKNRTVGELRHAFSAKGGNLAENGAVNWMFEKMGSLKGKADNLSEDSLLEMLLDFDIADLSIDEGTFFITCAPKALDAVKQALLSKNIAVESAELEWVPKDSIKLDDAAAQKAYDFLNFIEDLDDVQNVYTNLG